MNISKMTTKQIIKFLESNSVRELRARCRLPELGEEVFEGIEKAYILQTELAVYLLDQLEGSIDKMNPIFNETRTDLHWARMATMWITDYKFYLELLNKSTDERVKALINFAYDFTTPYSSQLVCQNQSF